MKKNKFLLIIPVLLIAFYSEAQNSDIRFGIKSGANISQYTPKYLTEITPDIRYAFKTGYYINGFVNIPLKKDFNLQFELGYTSQGSSFINENIVVVPDEISVEISESYKTAISELTIIAPITVQYFLTEKLNIETGTQLGFIFDRTEKMTQKKIVNEELYKNILLFNNSPQKKLDLGVLIGLGYKLSNKLSITQRSYWSFQKRKDRYKMIVLNIGFDYHF